MPCHFRGQIVDRLDKLEREIQILTVGESSGRLRKDVIDLHVRMVDIEHRLSCKTGGTQRNNKAQLTQEDYVKVG